MPLTGALQADFSDFVNETTKANAALGKMEEEAKKTGATLAKTGQVADGFGKNTSGFTQLSTGLRTADAAANAFGVSLAKPIAAVEELGKVSGMTYAQLGLLGTAGAAVGVALSAYEFGKWAAEWSGMNTAIQGVIRSMGLTGEEAEVAAYKQDILARASKTAGRAITDITEAMTINYDAVKRNTAAVDTAIHRQALWEAEIRKHRAELPEITAALENHTATVKQLETQYGMSAEAITYYVAKTKDQAAADREGAAAAKAQLTAQTELTELRKGYGVQLMSINAETLKAVQADLALGAGQGTVAAAYGLTAQQVKAASDQLELQLKITTGLGAEWANVGEKVKITADSVIADTNRMSEAARAYQAETDRMVAEAQELPPPIAAAKTETQQMSVAMRDLGGAVASVHQQMQAGMALMDAYREAGVATGMQTAMGGYNFSRIKRAGVMPTMGSLGAEAAGGNTLNVNVNSTDANNIAGKLVEEMRRQGVRF